MRILIVDDQEEMRELIRLSLQELDAEFLEAEDGATALSLFEQSRPAVVLLDVNIKGELNGFEVCQRIKQAPEGRGIKVVVISTRAQLDDLRQGSQAQADRYLTKPFSPAELHRLVTALLEKTPQ